MAIPAHVVIIIKDDHEYGMIMAMMTIFFRMIERGGKKEW